MIIHDSKKRKFIDFLFCQCGDVVFYKGIPCLVRNHLEDCEYGYVVSLEDGHEIFIGNSEVVELVNAKLVIE